MDQIQMGRSFLNHTTNDRFAVQNTFITNIKPPKGSKSQSDIVFRYLPQPNQHGKGKHLTGTYIQPTCVFACKIDPLYHWSSREFAECLIVQRVTKLSEDCLFRPSFT
jgi:hypothetical protein